MRFLPADENVGIVFVRVDLPGRPEVSCEPANVTSMPRWTALAYNGVWIHHTEHVLAALAFCQIDQVRIEVDGEHLPMTDGGTCAAFVAALRSVGRRRLESPRQVYNLVKGVLHLDPQDTQGVLQDSPKMMAGRYIVAVPLDRYFVTTHFHWPHLPGMPIGVAESEIDGSAADSNLIHARSYVVNVERDQVGDLLGPLKDDVMQLHAGCPPELTEEAARHKVVDFVGDLMVLGRPLRGLFVAYRTGHRIHADFLNRLVSQNLIELSGAS